MWFWLAIDFYIIVLGLAVLLAMTVVPSLRENRLAVVGAAPRVLLPMYPPRIERERREADEAARRAVSPVANLQAGIYICPYCKTQSDVGDAGACAGCGAPKKV